MGLIVQTTDFTGKYAIPQNSFSDLDSFIDKYEKSYLQDLLGAALCVLFLADLDILDTAPTNPIYTKIFAAFAEDSNGLVIKSEGMKVMLLGFIYWEWVREQKVKQTIGGAVVNSSEVSREASGVESNTFSRYNAGIETYTAIQWWIIEHSSDYPDFNGQQKKIASWL